MARYGSGRLLASISLSKKRHHCPHVNHVGPELGQNFRARALKLQQSLEWQSKEVALHAAQNELLISRRPVQDRMSSFAKGLGQVCRQIGQAVERAGAALQGAGSEIGNTGTKRKRTCIDPRLSSSGKCHLPRPSSICSPQAQDTSAIRRLWTFGRASGICGP